MLKLDSFFDWTRNKIWDKEARDYEITLTKAATTSGFVPKRNTTLKCRDQYQ